MTKEEIKDIKSKIFVYHIKPLDSLGIYIGDNKEEATLSLLKNIWDDVDPEFYEISEPINIIGAIDVWTWEEYQEVQGFAVAERILEICN